ncbi:class I SAM-dependent methyltransferase [Nitrospinota bacterium]
MSDKWPPAGSNREDIRVWDRFSFDPGHIRLALRNAPFSPCWPTFLQLVQESFDSADEVETIELGSGYGKFSLCANLVGCHTTLIDYNPSTVIQAQSVFSHFGRDAEIVAADALNLPREFWDRFDFSLSFGTAEHFSGPERNGIIEAHVRALKPGGRVFINVPNAFSFPYRLAFGLRRLAGLWPEGFHEIPFTRNELLRLGAEAGLRNCRVVPCTFFLDDTKYWIGENAKSLLRKLTGFPRGENLAELTFPPLEDLVDALRNPPPLAPGFFDWNFSYLIGLIGEKPV